MYLARGKSTDRITGYGSMKKIISGYFYRLIRGFEIWILVGLFLISTVYFLIQFSQQIYISCSKDFVITRLDTTIKKEDIRDHCYANLNISVRDLYRCYSEPVPEETYEKIQDIRNFASNECYAVLGITGYLTVIPTIIVLLIIPEFFGRLFSDSTIKNLVSCGHGKRRVFFSALLFCFALELIMVFAEIIEFALFCFIYQWHPPVYIPVLLLWLITKLISMFTLTSAAIAVLFISRMKTVTFITGCLLTVCLFISLSQPVKEMLHKSYSSKDKDCMSFEEYNQIAEDYGLNAFEFDIDLTAFRKRIYYEDKECFPLADSSLSPAQRTLLLTIIYLDPTLLSNVEAQDFGLYLECRDGLMAVNIVANIFWITLTSAAGIFIFNKREIHG